MVIDTFADALTRIGVGFERNNGHLEVPVADMLPIGKDGNVCACLAKLMGETPKLTICPIDHPDCPDAIEIQLASTVDADSDDVDLIGLSLANAISSGAVMPLSDEDNRLTAKRAYKGDGLSAELTKDGFVNMVRVMTCELCHSTN